MTTFIRSTILSAFYFCLVSYISGDRHFLKVYIECLVTALKSVLDELYCRVTALDKKLNPQVTACIRWAKVPMLNFKGLDEIKGLTSRKTWGDKKENHPSIFILGTE